MKKIFKIGIGLVVLVSMLFSNINDVHAASFTMSASTSTVAPGGSFTVTFGGDCTGRVNLSVSNGTLSSSAEWVEGNRVSVSVKAGSSGTVVVTASPSEGFSDMNGEPFNPGSRSVSVSIVKPQTSKPSTPSKPQTNTPVKQPADVTLKELTVSEGELSPAFNKDLLEYEVIVGNKTEKINITAKATNANAKVEGNGEITLSEIETLVSIKVSNDGENKEYKVKIIKETPVVTIDDLGVLNNFRGADALEGFEDYKVTINDIEVNAKKNPILDTVVVFTLDDEGNKAYYIYDEKKGKLTSIYKPIALLGKNYVIVTVPDKLQKLEGFVFGKVKIGESELEGWSYKDRSFKNYKLVYLMDENGKTNLYQYEESEQTLQIYDEGAPVSAKSYNETLEELKMYQLCTYVLVPCAIVIAILDIILIILLKKKKKEN